MSRRRVGRGEPAAEWKEYNPCARQPIREFGRGCAESDFGREAPAGPCVAGRGRVPSRHVRRDPPARRGRRRGPAGRRRPAPARLRRAAASWPPPGWPGRSPGQTLQATALVHEAYLRLVGAGDGRGLERPRPLLRGRRRGHAPHPGRGARRKQAGKHGGELRRVDLEPGPARRPGRPRPTTCSPSTTPSSGSHSRTRPRPSWSSSGTSPGCPSRRRPTPSASPRPRPTATGSTPGPGCTASCRASEEGAMFPSPPLRGRGVRGEGAAVRVGRLVPLPARHCPSPLSLSPEVGERGPIADRRASNFLLAPVSHLGRRLRTTGRPPGGADDARRRPDRIDPRRRRGHPHEADRRASSSGPARRPEMRRRVDELIDNHLRAGSFLESPAPDRAPRRTSPSASGPAR